MSAFFGARGKWGSQQSHGTVIRCEFWLLARAVLSDGGYSSPWLFAETRASLSVVIRRPCHAAGSLRPGPNWSGRLITNQIAKGLYTSR